MRGMGAGRLAALVIGVLLVTGGANAHAQTRRVALISIDGLRPVDYMKPEPCGRELPNLGELMRSGVYAEGVTGVLPTLTYPSHATLVTGAYPTRHGVLSNQRPRDGAPWHLDRSDIHATTLWDAARGAGLTVAIVTWPSSYGADVDDLVPENLSSAPDITDRIRAGSTPGLFNSLEDATGPIRLLPFSDAEAGVPLDRMTAAFASEIVRRHKPRLLLLHFLDLDHREHDEGPGTAGACRSLRRIDEFIGQVRAAYREAGVFDATAFFIVSDHGFLPVHTLLNIPVLLAAAGWATVEPHQGNVQSDLDVRIAEASAAFYPKQQDDPGLSRRIETELRPRIEPRYRGLARWITPHEAQDMGGFPGAAFVLCASPGYAFTSAPTSKDALLPSLSRRGTHGYCPDEPGMEAAFIASGSGIRRLGAIPRLRMIDIAPTVAALLGVSLPEADGAVIAGILDMESGR